MGPVCWQERKQTSEMKRVVCYFEHLGLNLPYWNVEYVTWGPVSFLLPPL